MNSVNDLAISVRGLCKAYTLTRNVQRHSTLAETMLHRLRDPFGKRQSETFRALSDVSFDVQKGEVIGIIGSNGAGKSTLLRIISRITEPTSGVIDLYGRVGSLLEVGTGFHPELSGRENIYLNGQILGMRRREIDRHFDAIVDFAGVEQFIDTPVKRYSSGMYVRLAFAVAAHLEPEILIVDEVLAVGDVAFQQKCLGKMQEVSARQGKTVLFVSHNMAAVRSLCSRAILLRKGRIHTDAPASEVVSSYLREETTENGAIHWTPDNPAECDEAALRSARVLDEHGTASSAIDCVAPFSFAIEYQIKTRVHGLRVGYIMRNEEGVDMCGSNDGDARATSVMEPGIYQSVVRFAYNPLNQGTYSVLFTISFPPHTHCVVLTPYCLNFRVNDTTLFGPGIAKRPGVLIPQTRWTVTPAEPGAMQSIDRKIAVQAGAF